MFAIERAFNNASVDLWNELMFIEAEYNHLHQSLPYHDPAWRRAEAHWEWYDTHFLRGYPQDEFSASQFDQFGIRHALGTVLCARERRPDYIDAWRAKRDVYGLPLAEHWDIMVGWC